MEDNAGLTKTVEDLQAERNELRTANSELACKKTGAADEMDSIRRQVKEQQAENARLKAEQQKQQVELQEATASLETARLRAEHEASELRTALFAAREEAREQGDTLEEVTERSRAQEELRRKMHETIQDLKGNIRVFCRVKGGAAPSAMGVRCPPTTDSSVIELLPPDATGKRPASGGMMRYQFDRVFDEATSQADVFAEVSQLTQSALDGFKVCIFAYGQTGSGKTFTMDGPRNKGADIRGVVPRAAEQAFARAEELRSLGWEYNFELSCLEIYNEELRDMLNRGNDKLKVVDSGAEVAVPGLSQLRVANAAELHAHLDAAARVRSTSSTKSNDQSSRSHFLFRLKITGVNEAAEQRTEGELNLVDLAGSERIKDSQVSGKALEEAKFINKSLTSLGDVISAMVTKSKHVPYRNSRLTHLLSNALRGKSKTLMFVNVSSAAEHHMETKSSLQFAQKVNGCDVGPAARGMPKTPPRR